MKFWKKYFISAILIYFLFTFLTFGFVYYWNTKDYSYYTKEEFEKEYLSTQNMVEDPISLIRNAFEQKDIVIIGENLKRKSDLSFLNEVLTTLNSKIIDVFAIEYISVKSKEKIEKLMSKKVFNRKLAKEILIDYSFFWCYEDYLKILETLHKINRDSKKKIRIIPLDPGIETIRNSDGKVIRRKKNLQKKMYNNFIRSYKKGEKALVYCQIHKSFTKYKIPMAFVPIFTDFVRKPTFGNLVYKNFKDSVFHVTLSYPLLKRWAYVAWNAYDKPYILAFRGYFDRVYDKIKTRFGFTTKNLDSLVDNQSYYSLYKKELKIKDFSDGYIFLKKIQDYKNVDIFRDFNESDYKYIKENWHIETSSFKTLVDFKGYLKSFGLTPEKEKNYLDMQNYGK